jgi:predicted TIM-barrel fold metal-dependent hydrolase
MTIDAHAHFLPDGVVAAMRARSTAPAIQLQPDGKERRLMPAGHTLPFARELYVDMDARLRFMDAHGIDRQVLSLGLLSGLHALPAAEAGPLARIFNDDLAALCGRHPDRFSGIALLPMDDIDDATAEFRRAMELGLRGAILPVNMLRTPAEAATLAPVFAAAQQAHAHLFIHPGPSPAEFQAQKARPATDPRDSLTARQAIGVQARLAEAAVTLLLTDFLDPYPDVTLQLANFGGTLAAVIERIDNAARLRDAADAAPSARLRRVYVDSASLGAKTLELAIAVFGADRVLFGTDCPIFRIDWMLAEAANADIDDSARKAFLHGNAARMLGLG